MKFIKLIKSTYYHEKDTTKKLQDFIGKAKQLSFGRECIKFEKNFSEYQGRKECILVNSGSSANLALIQALLNLKRIKKGDLIGFSALTWSTNVMPIIQLGFEAIPIDIELSTLNVSSKKLLEVLGTYPLKVVFITNLLGFCDDIDEIQRICKEKKIILIEDNCEALGTIYKKKKLGNFGLASTFSFYVGHHLSTVEGGAVCTDDKNLARMVRLVRAHGWDRNLDFIQQTEIRKKFKINSTFYSRYTFYDLGYNLRPTEINAFLGNVQLKYMNEVIEKRKMNFIAVAKALSSHSDMYYLTEYDHIDLISNFAIPVICKTVERRDELIAKCEGKIEIRPVVGGHIGLQPFFSKYMKRHAKPKPNAELVHKQGFYLGNNPEMTDKEIKYIIKILTS